MDKEYYYIDVDTQSLQVVGWGKTARANHTGETNNPNVHRVFLTKGQFNKLARQLNKNKPQ
jgi:hypothetical protein